MRGAAGRSTTREGGTWGTSWLGRTGATRSTAPTSSPSTCAATGQRGRAWAIGCAGAGARRGRTGTGRPCRAGWTGQGTGRHEWTCTRVGARVVLVCRLRDGLRVARQGRTAGSGDDQARQGFESPGTTDRQVFGQARALATTSARYRVARLRGLRTARGRWFESARHALNPRGSVAQEAMRSGILTRTPRAPDVMRRGLSRCPT